MAKQDASPLTVAAGAFDAELATYTRLGQLFVKTPLSSVKHLERANATLADIAACEERLQRAGQELVAALSTAREQQEQLAHQVVAHVPAVQDRNKQLQDLMNQLGALATEVGGLNTLIASRGANGDANKPAGAAAPTPEDARDLSATVFALSSRAEQLATTAREAEFEELATQAHALHQKLQVIGTKLASAGGAG